MKIKTLFFLFHCALFSLLFGQGESAQDSLKSKSGLAYFPIVYYTPETRLAFGAGVMHLIRSSPSERPSSFIASLIYTQNKQVMAELSTGFFFERGKYWHTGNFYYYFYPNSYYGIGNDTPDSAKEQYTMQVFRFNPSFLVRTSENLFIGPLIHYESWRMQKTETGRPLSLGTIPGSRSTTVTGVGVLVNYDERDNLFAATSGRFYQAAFIASPEFLGSTFSFTRLQLDAREYFPLGSGQVISAEALIHTTTGTVPFRFLPKLGGQNILRGYFEGRYRDNHMIVLQSEYRTPFWYRFGFALFGGIGEVANRFSRFQLSGMKISYGAGLRFAFIPDERIILRLDYGAGKNSDGVYITFNEAI